MSTKLADLKDDRQVFSLTSKDISLLNPNTQNCPLFRSSKDAELTKKIYQRVPVLEKEKTDSNPWGISFMAMFHMSNDSELFKNEAGNNLLPLYEAKMFHQFDHRWATYTDDGSTRDLTDEEKSDSNFKPQPRYWVDKQEVENKLSDKWNKNWLLSFRSITDSRNERSIISTFIPRLAASGKAPLIFPSVSNQKQIACLHSNLNSIIFDYIARQKIGGTDLALFIFKQLPVIPPEIYTEEDIEFISTRVLELVYTAWDMQPFAKDMGYEGEPFIWDEEVRFVG
jgi:hypothetical protein